MLTPQKKIEELCIRLEFLSKLVPCSSFAKSEHAILLKGIQSLLKTLRNIVGEETYLNVYQSNLRAMPVKKVTDIKKLLTNKDTVIHSEQMIENWNTCLQTRLFQEFLYEKSQPVFAGPNEEIDFWNLMYIKYNRVYHTFDSEMLIFAETSLALNNSRHLKPWKTVKQKVVNKHMQIKECVMNLKPFEKMFEGFYRNINDVKRSLENIFDILSIVQSFYFRSFNKRYMTRLMLSMFNQVVVSCVNYLTENKSVEFWTQSDQIIIDKLTECIALKEHALSCFTKMTNKIIADDLRPFQILMNSAFQSFFIFVERMEKIKSIVETYQNLKLEKNTFIGFEDFNSKLEILLNKFNVNKQNIESWVDCPTFQADINIFNEETVQWKIDVNNHLSIALEQAPDFLNKINLFKKWEKKNYFELDHMYKRTFNDLLSHYKSMYSDFRDNLPLISNVSVISGQIIWISTLYEKAQTSISFFLTKSQDLWGNYHSYKALCVSLDIFEKTLSEKWNAHISTHIQSENVPLLARDPVTRKYRCTLSRFINETIGNAQTMLYRGHEIPQRLQAMMTHKTMMYQIYGYADNLVKQYDQLKVYIREKCPVFFHKLINFEIYKIDKLFMPLLSTITWSSSEAMDTMQNITKHMSYSESFIKKIVDLDYALCKDIKNMNFLNLLKLPNEAIWPHEFERENNVHLQNTVNEIIKKSIALETKFNDIIKLFLYRINDKYHLKSEDEIYDYFNEYRALMETTKTDGEVHIEDDIIHPVDHPTSKQVDEWCMIAFRYYNFYYTQALINIKINSFNSLATKLERKKYSKSSPIIKTRLVLIDSKLTTEPPWHQIEKSIKDVTLDIRKSTTKIVRWGFHQRSGDYEYKTTISKKNEVIIAVKGISNLTKPIQMDLRNLYRQFQTKYQNIWMDESKKIDKINGFLKMKSELIDVRNEFIYIEKKSKEINEEPHSIVIGPLDIELDEFKEYLNEQIKHWKMLFTESILKTSKLTELSKYVTDNYLLLTSQIKSLDDAKKVITSLEEIEYNWTNLEIDVDHTFGVYDLLNTYKVEITPEDERHLNILTENYSKLKIQKSEATKNLLSQSVILSKEMKDGIKQLKKDVIVFNKQFEERGPMVSGLSPAEATERVLLFSDRFEELVKLSVLYQNGEELLLGKVITDFPSIAQKRQVFNFLKRLYDIYNKFNRYVDTWLNIQCLRLPIDEIIEALVDCDNRCRKLPAGLKLWPTYLELKTNIDEWMEKMPLIEGMFKNPLKPRHWTMIENLTKTQFPINDSDCTLRVILNAPLLEYKEELEDICQTAIKEIDIEAKLRQIISDWSTIKIELTTFKNRGLLLVKSAELGEVVALLEDSQMIMSSLASNRYNASFKTEINEWVKIFARTSQVLENWVLVQNLWMYLEVVFIGGDISKQLPQETKRFLAIDKLWTEIMHKARFLEIIIKICDESMEILLPYMFEQLESCQKSLAGYLDQKRYVFPRFYFISDPSLLEILGQSSNSHSITPHLLSLFDNIAKLTYSPTEYDKALWIVSKEGEGIQLEHPVLCNGGVEIWLNTLHNEAKHSVNTILSNVASYITEDPTFSLLTMVDTFPSQVGLVGIQILWTYYSENAIKNAVIKKTIMKQTNAYFLTLLNVLIDTTTKNLTKMERLRYETLITIHVHQRDIFETLFRMKVKTTTDFEWLKQERFYHNKETDHCEVEITDVLFEYQNEFMGCSDRLVITPLTDRTFITLAQAVGMNMGGAPAGPAGTGKTETTKDMGKSLGKYVVVFNCSDQMDFRGLGRIFKGLVHSGTWGCFDEFNRIELPVLSVAAQQIYTVFCARRDRKETFIMTDGESVPMNPEFAIFLTMNPGYAGRQELPENLKVLFRSVAMMVPDRLLIIRVKLAACGFKSNLVLSRKFFMLYQLCEEQLSKQVHYDFGLRNILAVLRTLGTQRRSNPNESEETILMRVLKGMNVSKLIDQDETIFLSLIEDLFVGMKSTITTYKDLQAAITATCSEKLFVNHPVWNLKIIQIYETSVVRHGLMILGPTGSGKTAAIHCLLSSLTKTGLKHFEYRMNPKAITASQMFGKLDVATNDWTDGIFSTLWRRTLKLNSSEYCWIVLDGPVDAVWIENLNSVLDDNKTLTLANGDRIVMAPNAKLSFEPDNVDNASPATISRMGMTYFSSTVLPWKVMFEGWAKTKSSHEYNCFKKFFNRSFQRCLTLLQSKFTPKMVLSEANYIRQTCDILDGLLKISPQNLEEIVLSRLYTFAIMWSIAAVLESIDRRALEEFIRTDLKGEINIPSLKGEESIYEYTISKDGGWQHWGTLVDEYTYPSDYIPNYGDILVPNLDNVRAMFLISLIANQDKNVLLIGEQGTAKTVMIKSFMAEFDPEERISKMLNFSSATTPDMFQNTVEGSMEKRFGTTYGPPGNRKMSIFIDDINMPIINDWGDQITNEITRQLLECKGFYSLIKPGDFVNIVGVNMLAAMIHPGGGRNDIPPRLKRQFCIFNCTLPSDTSMDKIFGALGCGYFCIERFNEVIVQFVPKLMPLTRFVWQKIKQKLLPTPANFHYVFNLRDLSRIWEGMLQIQTEECKNVHMLIHLWCNEIQRVIYDKLTNISDKQWFIETVENTAKEFLTPKEFQMFPEDMRKIVFADFMRDEVEATGNEPEDFESEVPKIYEYVENYDVLKSRIFMYMQQMNEVSNGTFMDLVLFEDCVRHIIIISRILRIPRGNALLVGIGGSGRKSVTTLASFIAKYIQHTITLTRTYGLNNFLDDIRILYRYAGFNGSKTAFVFTDNDIKEEAFLEYINNILSSGEVANLFPKDELEEMLNNLTPSFKKKNPKGIITMENLYEFFIKQAMNNLHLVLCFSPIGESFRLRSLKFPGLISGSIIDWYTAWPQDALQAVSGHFLHNFSVVSTEKGKLSLIELLGEIHENVSKDCVTYFQRFRRQVYVTPKSFLSFVDGYKVLYVGYKKEIEIMKGQRILGLEKLADASIQVEVLKIDLVEKEKEIVIATAASTEVTTKVNLVVTEAEKSRAEVAVVKNRAEVLLKGIAKEKQVAEVKLAKAQPALDAAEAALLTINSTDIATVRKLGKPPYLITLIMDSVLIFFKRKVLKVKPDTEKLFLEPNWAESLKLMSDTRFLFNLQNFPKDQICGEIIDLLTPYFTYSGYSYDKAKIACGNVAGLLSWTLAMSDFYNVNKEVLPLKANLAIQEGKHSQAKEQLKAAEAIASEKTKQLLEAKRKLNGALQAQNLIEAEADTCRNKMDSATALIEGLEGERTRWTQQLAGFNLEINNLLGDVVVLTAFLSYSGPFNQEYRNKIRQSIYDSLVAKNIPHFPNLSVTEKLVDPPTISEWNLQGLPNDELSTQNGIIVTKSSKYPIMIDPQSQGIAWIKNKEAINNLLVTSFDDKYFRTYLEDCLSLGRPLLIQDVLQDVDPVVNNILEKNVYKVGRFFKVLLGDKEVDISDDFRLYFTTKLGNPSFPPELYARCVIIDFTVTIKGLEDQLLSRVIETEKKELEQQRIELIAEVTSQKRKMQELELDLLVKLTTVKGSLVDDETVLLTLNKTKNTAFDVSEKLKVASKTQESISLVREEYRQIATRGSVLYFLIVEMGLVNPMYQNSLQQFLEQFDLSLLNSEPNTGVIQRRISNVIEYLTFQIFKYKCRGLYEKHKTLFVILMALKIDLEKENITMNEFEYFIKGGASVDLNSISPKPFSWITDICWMNLGMLKTITPFVDILSEVERSEILWKNWYEESSPETTPIPGYGKSNEFQRLLIVRAWCPDRTLNQAYTYVEESLGPQYVESVALDVEGMYNESRSTMPLICFLSMGSDPSSIIEKTAKKLEIPFFSISMGQGQEVHANKLLLHCSTDGGWVLLQNCHLCLDFLQETFEFINSIGDECPTIFRLFITTEVHPKFPISLLQISIHYTYEPPEGLRAGLMRTYHNMGEDILNYSNLKPYRPILYVISFLHSVVQERRKFGPIGWNIPYEFNSSDWFSSTLYLQKIIDGMDANGVINWTSLRYMLAEVHYGGRVTDDYDRRLLNILTQLWLNEEIFNEKFCFYEGYSVLSFSVFAEYFAAIEELPLKDPPQACGLHPNTDITYQTNNAEEMFETIKQIQPKGSGGGGGATREEKVYAMATDILERLPATFDMFKIRERLIEIGPTQPMNIFLGQEIDRIQKVISLVKNTLEDLLLAIDGIIIMNEDLTETTNNIYDGKVPGHWISISWTSSAIGFWFEECLKRHKQIDSWIFTKKPILFWMTGFFNPQGFLTSMKQEISRAHNGWTLDNIALENEVTVYTKYDIQKGPLEGVFCYGLFLDGAGWNKRQKELQEAIRKVIYTEMPVIHIYAVNSVETKPLPGYRCPLYRKPRRTGLTYISELRLETPQGISPNEWVLRGVALLCDIK